MRESYASLVGKTFNFLTVTDVFKVHEHKITKAKCLCKCGSEHICDAADVKRGHAKSCGCFQKIRASEANTTHGFTKNRNRAGEYAIWCSIKERCINENSPRYKDYGGRGIGMCERWVSSFSTFYQDMGPRPSTDHSIDRIDNDGNYCPENCRWATMIEQANNTRLTKKIRIGNEEKTARDWSYVSGVKHTLINNRINRGWTSEEAVFTPVSKHNKIVTIRRTCHLQQS